MSRFVSRAVLPVIFAAFLPLRAYAIQFTVSSLPGDLLTVEPSSHSPNYAEIQFVSSNARPFPDFFRIDGTIDGIGGAIGTIFHGGITSQVWDPKPLGGNNPSVEQAFFGEYADIFLIDDTGNSIPLSFGIGDAQFLYSFQYDSHTVLRFGFNEGRTSGLPGIQFADPDLNAFFKGDRFSIAFEITVFPSRSLSDLMKNGGGGAFRATLTSIRMDDSAVPWHWLALSLVALSTIRCRKMIFPPDEFDARRSCDI